MLKATDFYRAANYLISRYGDEAGDRAANRASALGAAGDADLQAIWERLLATVREIEKQTGASAAARTQTRPE